MTYLQLTHIIRASGIRALAFVAISAGAKEKVPEPVLFTFTSTTMTDEGEFLCEITIRPKK